jgi:hypothetical protein
VNDRLIAVDLVLLLESLGRELVHPGEDQREREAESEKRKQELSGPAGHTDHGEQHVGDLQDEPAGDQVERRHPHHVTALEFGEE